MNLKLSAWKEPVLFTCADTVCLIWIKSQNSSVLLSDGLNLETLVKCAYVRIYMNRIE